MRHAERRQVNVLEMKCWRNLVEVSQINRVRKEELHRRGGMERELASRADQSVLRYLGMWKEWMSTIWPEVVDGRTKWRVGMRETEVGWMDSVKVALGTRGMTVEAAQQCMKDRKEWRTLVHM